ncbi:cutinase [Mycobacterium kubicae]|uniref:Cutinase n=1 Tax=Mycobacterium kubicae TaxID=120959 RepID=A0AAX1JI73_9MYCO|nr:cutinase family protein [Mycobacterium kubicae]MCV7098801.1 cutinase family protein [Mycobacterium kubicae]OBF18319.1 cutinase [Mycobacterium kubicae]OBK51849.1 cutinase [Mycobacterium kubicae]ORW03427.1 cutinase [Mycobacterium kubicae]QNI11867.1 cutinase family protein [Mycobacterium kubicae]
MGTYRDMISRHVARFVGPAVITAWGMSASILSGSAVPIASAEPCPDAEVVFARGTGEAPGVGPTGEAFINDLRPRIGGKSLGVYAVNYPASDQWATGVDGVRDAGAHVNNMAHTCPKTQMVLSGFSQGAAVMGFVTSAAVPDGVDPNTVPRPLDPEVANHVSSVVLFGLPNTRAMEFLGQPPVAIGPLYQAKTMKICATDDPVCSEGLNFAAHNSYADGGAMIDQGAAFAASRLGAAPGGPPPPPAEPSGFGE